MKKEQVTYSTDDMLKLINMAATNLLIKKKKISLEARIRKQREERDYTMELLSRASKKVEELDPELRKAEESTREYRELFALLKARRDALKDEVERLREIEKKVPLLQQMTAEVMTLRERVDLLQVHNDRVRSVYIEKGARKEELENKKSCAVSAMHELREKLAYRTADWAQFIARISWFDLLETLRKESFALGYRLSGKVDLVSLKEELAHLIALLQHARQVDDICRIIEKAGTEESGLLTDLTSINDSGILSGIREEMKKYVANFAAYVHREQYRLEERMRAIDGEIDSVGEKLESMKADLPLLEEAIRSEQESRDRSQVQLKGLEDERVVQTAEMKRMEREAERFLVTREINRIFTESLDSSNEYLSNINMQLGALLEEYKRDFEKVARVIREDAR